MLAVCVVRCMAPQTPDAKLNSEYLVNPSNYHHPNLSLASGASTTPAGAAPPGTPVRARFCKAPATSAKFKLTHYREDTPLDQTLD